MMDANARGGKRGGGGGLVDVGVLREHGRCLEREVFRDSYNTMDSSGTVVTPLNPINLTGISSQKYVALTW